MIAQIISGKRGLIEILIQDDFNQTLLLIFKRVYSFLFYLLVKQQVNLVQLGLNVCSIPFPLLTPKKGLYHYSISDMPSKDSSFLIKEFFKCCIIRSQRDSTACVWSFKSGCRSLSRKQDGRNLSLLKWKMVVMILKITSYIEQCG